MRVIATPVKGKDLKPGDLFSTANHVYWENILAGDRTIGERVYLRTNAPCPPDEEEADIYRLTIER